MLHLQCNGTEHYGFGRTQTEHLKAKRVCVSPAAQTHTAAPARQSAAAANRGFFFLKTTQIFSYGVKKNNLQTSFKLQAPPPLLLHDDPGESLTGQRVEKPQQHHFCF